MNWRCLLFGHQTRLKADVEGRIECVRCWAVLDRWVTIHPEESNRKARQKAAKRLSRRAGSTVRPFPKAQ